MHKVLWMVLLLTNGSPTTQLTLRERLTGRLILDRPYLPWQGNVCNERRCWNEAVKHGKCVLCCERMYVEAPGKAILHQEAAMTDAALNAAERAVADALADLIDFFAEFDGTIIRQAAVDGVRAYLDALDPADVADGFSWLNVNRAHAIITVVRP